MKQISRKGIINKLDTICSQIIRKRGYCVWCGSKRTEILQCCHIVSRSNLQTRWYLNNLLCMCAGCHFKAHKHPIEFAEFVKKFLGEEEYEILRKKANENKKWATYELVELYERFKEIV